MSATLNEILDDLEDAGQLRDEDALYEAFVSWAEGTGRPLYPHQEEALVEILAGNHVIAATPTGSGKSMIALAAHFTSMAHGGRSYYTAPLKALVSEKFFDLVSLFGADNVGMVTGDVSLNADAPIICCTAEILANQSLREGPTLDADMIVMDEFHFYGDRQRGWAWQVPRWATRRVSSARGRSARAATSPSSTMPNARFPSSSSTSWTACPTRSSACWARADGPSTSFTSPSATRSPPRSLSTVRR